jgi:hypothetical protein
MDDLNVSVHLLSIKSNVKFNSVFRSRVHTFANKRRHLSRIQGRFFIKEVTFLISNLRSVLQIFPEYTSESFLKSFNINTLYYPMKEIHGTTIA